MNRWNMTLTRCDVGLDLDNVQTTTKLFFSYSRLLPDASILPTTSRGIDENYWLELNRSNQSILYNVKYVCLLPHSHSHQSYYNTEQKDKL
jgi:hypothetical protein